MLVKFRQRWTGDRMDFTAGEEADLPASLAAQIVRRGIADPVETKRLKQPEQNRIRRPKQNRRA